VTGTGGIGKTRLALEVAALAASRFPAGVVTIEFARISEPQAVPALAATTLSIQLHTDSVLSQRVQETVHQPLLLILDNCEHLIDAVASLAQDLIENTEWVSVLATSRESLSLPGERLVPLAPLTVPSPMAIDLDTLWATESVQLFMDRAHLHDPRFQLTSANSAAVRDICRRLDGIPLAIELAAAHVRVLSPMEILERLNNRFGLLKARYRGMPARQQTLRAVFDWSYDLLTETEQRLWQRLSMFAPGFSLDAVHDVVSDQHLPQEEVLDAVRRLVSKSIVTRFTEHGVTLYKLLETMREYGHEKLAQTHQVDVFHARHKDYYANQMRQMVDKMFNNPVQLLPELDNVHEALDYALASGDSASAMAISAILAFYTHARGTHNTYNYESLRRAIDSADMNDISKERALALVGIGFLARALNKADEAVLLLQQAVQVAQESGDGFAMEFSLTHLALALPHTASAQKIDTLHHLLAITDHWISTVDAHSVMSQHYLWTGETSVALHHARLSVEAARNHSETFYYALALGTQGTAELVSGSPEKAIPVLETAVNFLNNIHHAIGVCDFLLPLARAYQILGQREQAVRALGQALHLLVDMDLNHYVNDKSIVWIAWTFVIAADFHWSNAIRSGAHIIIDETEGQPKYLREECRTLVREMQGASRAKGAPTDLHSLSRKEWVQEVLRELEAEQVTRATAPDLSPNSHGLTVRELDVLRALSQGLSNRSIANSLHISESTVRTYLSHVYGKLGVASRTEALVQARNLGLVDS
jgi:non-specific serine/threonine protein kinase